MSADTVLDRFNSGDYQTMPSNDGAQTPGTPGRPGVSFEAYEQAYRELSAEDGTPPSQRQIRKYLGTGSNTTLAGYRRRIAEESVIDGKPLEPKSLDAELFSTVQHLASQIALNEAQIADDRVEEVKRIADNRVHIAESTMEKRLRDTDVLEHRAARAESDIEELRTSVAEKDAELIALATAHQTLKEENAALVQASKDTASQIAHQSVQLHRCEEELRQAKELATTYALESKAELVALQTRLNDTNASNTELCDNIKVFEEQLKKQESVINSCNTRRDTLQHRLDESIQFRERTQLQLEQIQGEGDSLNSQRIELTTELKAERRAHQSDVSRYETALKEQASQINYLQATVTTLSQKLGTES